jgi:hypothetical protein
MTALMAALHKGIQKAQIYFLQMAMSREYRMEIAMVLLMKDGQMAMLTRE